MVNNNTNPAPRASTSKSVLWLVVTLNAFLSLPFCSLHAQETFRPKKDSTIEEKLVARALAGPTILKTDHQNKINALQVKKIKTSYLNLLSVSTGYTFRTTTNTNGLTYAPGLNLGVTIPIGIFFTKATDVKIAKETQQLNLYTTEQLIRDTKADVLTKYKAYQVYSELIILQSKSIDDQQAATKDLEEKFRKGQVSLELYTVAGKTLNDEMGARLRTILLQAEAKYAIEALIGEPLDNLLR